MGDKHEKQNSNGNETKQIHLPRHSPNYWRVTLDRPPLDIFGPETIPQLNGRAIRTCGKMDAIRRQSEHIE
jgi:hypothetical protein